MPVLAVFTPKPMELISDRWCVPVNPGIMTWFDRIGAACAVSNLCAIIMSASDWAFYNDADMLCLATFCTDGRFNIFWPSRRTKHVSSWGILSTKDKNEELFTPHVKHETNGQETLLEVTYQGSQWTGGTPTQYLSTASAIEPYKHKSVSFYHHWSQL